MSSLGKIVQEDFNSDKATQFEIPFDKAKYLKDVPGQSSVVFFEPLPKRPFNLDRYMMSFETSAAHESMRSYGDLRGSVFNGPQNLYVFAWAIPRLHAHFMRLLDSNVGKYLYPNFKYLKSYNSMNLVDNTTPDVPNEWCFSFVWFEKMVVSNLGDEALYQLNKQKNISELFMLRDPSLVLQAIKRGEPKTKKTYRV